MNKKIHAILPFVLLFTFLLGLISSGSMLFAETFEKGKIIEKVTCTLDASESYSLYLPSSYSSEIKYPVLFTFDPAGRAMMPQNIFKTAAETLNYIVVCPYNVKNGPNGPVVKAMNAVWNDICSRFAVDKQRIYAAGFSGGSRVSSFFSMVIRNPVRGIIGVGAGLSTGVTIEHVKGISYYGIVGYADFNYREMIALQNEFKKAGIIHHFMYYDSSHKWPPEPLCTRALEWMELNAMKQNLTAKKEPFIQSIYEHETKLTSERETSGEIYYAALEYESLAAIFNDLIPQTQTDSLLKKSTDLKNSKEFKKFEKDDQNRLKEEQETLGNFLSRLNMLKTADPMETPLNSIFSSLNLKKLDKEMTEKKNPYDSGLAERILYNIGITVFPEAEAYILGKDFKRASILMEIAETACKRSVYYPYVFYNMAVINALQGKTEKAIKYLHEAINNGFKNFEAMKQDKDLDSIKNTEEYKKIIASGGQNPF